MATEVETWVLIGGYAVRNDILLFVGALILVIIGVWYALLRKKGTEGEEGGTPPA